MTRKKSKRRPLEHKILAVRQSQRAAAVRRGIKQVLPEGIRNEVLLAARLALDALRRGTGTPTHWVQVSDALRMAQALDEQVYGGEHLAALSAGAAAHAACAQRNQDEGKALLYTGPELQAVMAALEIHEAQMEQSTWEELRAAMRAVEGAAPRPAGADPRWGGDQGAEGRND